MVRLQANPTVVLPSALKATPAKQPAPRRVAGYAQQTMLTGGTLLVADLLALSIAFLVAAGVFRWVGNWTPSIVSVQAGTAAVTIFVLYTLRMYPAVGMHPAIELRGTILGAAAGGFSHLLLSSTAFTAGYFFASMAVGLVLLIAMPMGRSLARSYSVQRSWWGIRAIVIGNGEQAESIHGALRKSIRRGLRPVGWIDRDEVVAGDSQLEMSPYDSFQDHLEKLSDSLDTHWVILAIEEDEADENAILLRTLQRKWVYTTILYLDTAMILPSVDSNSVEIADASGLHICNRLLLPGSMIIKRSVDIAVALAVATLALPLTLVLAALIKLSSAGPAFYSQERIGRSGKSFRAWKFRTMVSNADAVLSGYLDAHPEMRAEWERDHKLKNDPRITKVGRLLRKTSLDELPQLLNILRGEMSLVGPRPIVKAEIEKYGIDYYAYAGVLPGVTGLWQISGRNNTTYEERVRLDAYYVRNWSPWLDLYILVRTLKVVLLQEGAY